MQRWGVIGGGVLGMSIADRLAEAGHEVTLLEAAPDLGGLAATWQIGDVVWDRHYHVIVPTDRRTLGLVEGLGLGPQLCWQTVPAGCEADGGGVVPATTPAEILRLPFLGPVAKARLGLTALAAFAQRDLAALGRVPVLDWLRRWSGEEATERFWLPLLRAKLGDQVERTSALFIATTLRRLATARREGGITGDGFGFVSGGYATVLDAMAARLHDLGVRTVLGSPVTAVRTAPDDDAGRLVVEVGDDEHRFDRVVVTAAAPVAARLLPGLSEPEQARLTGVSMMGIVCLSVLLDAPLTPNYITYLRRPAPFTAVIDMSALVGPDQVGGHGLVYLPRYLSSDDPVFTAPPDERPTEEQLTADFLADLARVYPQLTDRRVVATRLSTVRYVLPVPTLGYSDRLPPVATSVPGVYLASSALITDGTLNVDETLGVVDRVMPTLLAPEPAQREAVSVSSAMPASVTATEGRAGGPTDTDAGGDP